MNHLKHIRTNSTWTGHAELGPADLAFSTATRVNDFTANLAYCFTVIH
jgi:hypothetical protein